MSKKESHLIRIDEELKQRLDELRSITIHGKSTNLSYNDVIYELLGNSFRWRRQQICEQWIQYGSERDLNFLLKRLHDLPNTDGSFEKGHESKKV